MKIFCKPPKNDWDFPDIKDPEDYMIEISKSEFCHKLHMRAAWGYCAGVLTVIVVFQIFSAGLKYFLL